MRTEKEIIAMENTRVSTTEKPSEARPAARVHTAGKPGATAAPGSFLSMLSDLENEASDSTGAGMLLATGLLGSSVGQGPLDELTDVDANASVQDLSGLASVLGQVWTAGYAIANAEGSADPLSGKQTGSRGDGGDRGDIGRLVPAAGSDVAGLLSNSLWAGHVQSPDNLVAQTSRIDTAREAFSEAVTAQLSPRRGTEKKPGIALAAGAAAMQLTKTSHGLASLTSDGASAVTRQASALAAVAGANAGLNGVDQRLSSSMESLSVRLPSGLIATSAGSDVQGLMAAATSSRGYTRASDAGHQQSSGGATYSDARGVFQPGMEPGSEFSTIATGSALSSAEDAIAEQVTYWLTDSLKNAQLTVDHEGQAVDVRVSLTGNEAHVAFRSDQAQTRALLDAHIADLRDLLLREGLQLSGVTVDAQDAGKSSPDRQHPSREGRQTVQVAAAVERGLGAIGVQSLAKRSQGVDLFV